jgi:hypothetical protein
LKNPSKPPFFWYCPICNEPFPSMLLLRFHFRKFHIADLLRKCPICGKKFTVAALNHYARLGKRDPWHASVYILLPRSNSLRSRRKLWKVASEFLSEPHNLEELKPIILENVKPPWTKRMATSVSSELKTISRF